MIRFFAPFSLLIGTACLEHVTGQAVPLDERFYKAAEARHGDPSKGDGSSDPFASIDGEKVVVSGIVSCETMGSIDLDFRTPDPSAEGGMKGQGKLLLERPGVFSLEIPKGTGLVEIQAFQDIQGDGPSFDDPFAQVKFEVLEEDIVDLELALVEGARNDDPNPEPPPNSPQHEEHPHQEHPHENKEHGDQPNGGRPGQHTDDPFGDYSGETVKVSGKIICDSCTIVDLDLFAADENEMGGRKMLGKIKVGGSDRTYSFDVPLDFGGLILEAFVDTNGDGPGPGDLMGIYQGNPLQIQSDDIDDINITLSVPADGKMPSMPIPPPK